jgi:hypothetical protein
MDLVSEGNLMRARFLVGSVRDDVGQVVQFLVPGQQEAGD